MSNLAAGLLAGLALALVFVLYMLARERKLAGFFRESEESLAKLPEDAFFYIMMACFVAAGLLFGALSGLVYGWIGSPTHYMGLALGLALCLSVLAAVSKQPLVPDKIIWNFAVGGVLGILVPLLTF